MDDLNARKDIDRISKIPFKEAFKTDNLYSSEGLQKPQSAMEQMWDWLTQGGYKYCEQIVIDKAEELVEKERNNQINHA